MSGPDDLLARMRVLEIDHDPDGWPAVKMRDVSALCDEIERLRAAVLAEREACAEIAADSDYAVQGTGYYDQLGDANQTAYNIEQAIRARPAP
jgi:hypothetical protein